MFLLSFSIQGCDDDELVAKVVFSTEEVLLKGNESSKVVTYAIEDRKEGTELVFELSDNDAWSFIHNSEQQKIEIKCAAEHSMTDITGSLQVQVIEGGKNVSVSELKVMKEASPNLESDLFSVTPQVLEAIGGKVPVTINGSFPKLYFDENAIIEVTPVIKWNGGEAKGQSAIFQGEKVEGNDQSISYKMGGSYTMKTSFDYVPEMAKSELYLKFKATIGEKTISIPDVKIADGVISTS